MKLKLKLITLTAMLAGLTFGQTLTTTQTISGTIISAAHSGTLFQGAPGNFTNATETNVATLAGIVGTVANLNVKATAPGGSDTILVTVRKNGADTTVTCTITGAATTCADATHSFTTVATDTIDISYVFSTAVTGAVGFSATMTNATGTGTTYNNHTLFAGSAPTLSACGTSPTATNSTDNAGVITLGTGAISACTATFATAFTNTPACTVTSNNNVVSRVSAVSTSAVTFKVNYTGASKLYYSCF